jgi:bacterial/archaeal transporter family protein
MTPESGSPALTTQPLHAFKTQWFWYSIFCLVCWGPYALCSKLGSIELPALSMQFLFTLGGIPIALAVLFLRRFRLERSPLGITYAVLVGILSTIGGTALFAAYGTRANTAMVTVVSGLYPLVTVLLAVTILRERLTRKQWLGLAFAGAACVLFSF